MENLHINSMGLGDTVLHVLTQWVLGTLYYIMELHSENTALFPGA